MKRLRLKRRPLVIKNLIVFVVLSFIYYMIIQNYIFGFSIFNNVELLTSLLRQNLLIIILSILGCFWALNWFKYLEWFFIFFALTILWPSIDFAVSHYDKVVLLSGFIYAVFSIFLFFIIKNEKQKALYLPSYFYNQIGKRTFYPLRVSLHLPDKTIEGDLTNWDESSCFVSFDEDVQLKGTVILQMTFDDVLFGQKAVVTTQYDSRGYGFVFKPDKKEIPGWDEFFSIISDRGYQNG